MIVTKKVHVNGMQCNGCESIVEEAILQLDGVVSVEASYVNATAKIRFDENKTSLSAIRIACETKGYTLELNTEVKNRKFIKISISLLALAGLFILIMLARKYGFIFNLPEINSQMGIGMIFLVGLLTGIHCIGMCGSFIVGYTARDVEKGRSSLNSHLMYGIGKTVSYAIVGSLFGFVGSLFRITPLIGGISICIAGVFLILYGLNMLNIFSVLKSIRIKQPASLTNYISKKRHKTKSPLIIGFFSGFILGCGPLQVMYVMAAGNGNALEGAIFLAIFGLGTLPALLAFGFIARLLSKAMNRRFLYASGIILIVLGTMMLSKGILRTRTIDDSKILQPKCCCHEPVVKS